MGTQIPPMHRGSTRPDHRLSPFDSDLTKQVIGAFYLVYSELGYGFLEAVYCNAMLVALNEEGIAARREAPIDSLSRTPSWALSGRLTG